MRLAAIFVHLRDLHRVKDTGAVPNRLAQHGWESEIVTLRKRDLHQAGFPPLRLLGRPFSLRALWWVTRNARRIDVLMLFHTAPSNFFYGWMYRLRNPKGIVYVKADMDNTILALDQFSALNLVRRIKIPLTLGYAHAVSIEQRRVFDFVRKRYARYAKKMFLLPNGSEQFPAVHRRPLAKKENVILVVGYIGSVQKATDVVLEIARRLDLSDWKIVLAGEVVDGFGEKLATFFEEHPRLRTRIHVRGYVKDRTEMFDLYDRAKILLMPSRWEGFPLAVVEAGSCSNVIVGTPVGGVVDVTDDGKIGAVCPFGDADALAAALTKRMRDRKLWEREARATRERVEQEFSWEHIIPRLDERLRVASRKR